MLHYPKIPGSRNTPDGRCVAFEKYDGTNLHWDWDRDFGWHAFGTRRDEFNLTPDGIEQFGRRHEHLRGCADVFNATLTQLARRDSPPLQWTGPASCVLVTLKPVGAVPAIERRSVSSPWESHESSGGTGSR